MNENWKRDMKGVVVEGINKVLIKRDISMCKVTEYEALCKNIAGAICTGTDLAIISGESERVKYPTILGHESVGVVVATGSKVENINIGDIVTSPRMLHADGSPYYSTWGGFCEFGTVMDFKKLKEDKFDQNVEMYYCNQVVPKGVGIRDAVMSITWSETLGYLQRINLESSQKVLLIGSGSVALSFATLLSAMNIDFCIVGSNLNQDKYRSFGKIHYVDYSNSYLMEDFRHRYREYFDCIIDAVGAKDTVNYLCRTLKQNSKVCIFGKKCGETYEILNENTNQHIKIFDGSYSVKDSYKIVFQMIQNRQLSANPWFEKTYQMEHILEAIKDLKSRKIIKALIQISEDDTLI